MFYTTLTGLDEAQAPFSVVRESVVRCAIRDGIIGSETMRLETAETYEAAMLRVAVLAPVDEDGCPYDEESRVFVLDARGRRVVRSVFAPPACTSTDEIPF